LVAVPALFANMDLMVDLTSIGTLFAFALVSAGVMKMHAEGHHKPKFKVTYINAKWIYPIAFVLTFAALAYFDSSIIINYLGLSKGFDFSEIRMVFPHYLYLAICLYLIYFSVKRNASLLPMLALLSCGYLLSESGARNWERFIIWLVIGFVIYFVYGQKRSKLA
jgi:hypothetical protein